MKITYGTPATAKNQQLKLCKGSEQTFLWRRYVSDEKVHAKVFNITNYQENANQIHSEILPHICQNDYHKDEKTNWNEFAEIWNAFSTGGNVEWCTVFHVIYSFLETLALGLLELLISTVYIFYFLTLQYCIGFAIHQHESATGTHVLPILNPPPSPYHPSRSSQCTSPKHPASCIEPGLATRLIYVIIHVSMPFSQIKTCLSFYIL